MYLIDLLMSSFSAKEKIIYLLSWIFLLGVNTFLFLRKKSIKERKEKNMPYRIYLSLVKSLQKILGLFFVLFSSFLLFTSCLRNFKISEEFEKILSFLFLFSIFFFVFRFFKEVEKDFHQNKKAKMKKEGETKAEGFFLFVKIFVIFLGILFTLHIFGLSLNSILAIGGIGGVFFGMATKDLLSNVFGGMMLFINGDFGIGDYIEGEKNIKGTVEHVGIHSTLLCTKDNSVISVPNQLFSQMVINNFSQKENYPMEVVLSIKTSSVKNLQALLSELVNNLESDPKVDKSKKIEICWQGFYKEGLLITLRLLSKTKNVEQIRQNIQAILAKLGNQEIEIREAPSLISSYL